MEIGVGIDGRLNLSFAEERQIAREAAELGYTSIWTPSGAGPGDPFQVCAQWWEASKDVIPGGLTTGIGVIPAPVWTPHTLAGQAAGVGALTDGQFILGIGTGGLYTPGFRQQYDLPDLPAVGTMRDYLVTLRGLMAGEAVSYTGKAIRLRNVQIPQKAHPVPLYLAALGPQMLRLAGALADGVALNWCTPAQRAWCREQVAAGAARHDRAPSAVKLMEFVRLCVDDDVTAARRAYGRQVLGYALVRPGASNDAGYRGHFKRMGFDEVLTELEARRAAGDSEDALVDATPDALLNSVGYYGPASGAAAAFRRLAEGLDIAVVRVITVRPGLDAVRAPMQACRPSVVVAA